MQQTQYQQQQENQIYVPPQKKHNLIAMSLIIIVIIGAIGLYFAIKPKLESAMAENNLENSPDFQAAAPPVSTIPQVEITTLKLCNSVDDNFNCDENTGKIFKRGDTLYVYAQVFATSKNIGNNPSIRLSQEIKILGGDNKILLDDIEDLTKETDLESGYIFPLSKEIKFSNDDPLGKGTITISFTDKNTNEKTTGITNFELK